MHDNMLCCAIGAALPRVGVETDTLQSPLLDIFDFLDCRKCIQTVNC